MIKVVKSVEKSFCSSCGKYLPDRLWNIEISTKVSGGIKGTDMCGLCENCLKQLSGIINEHNYNQ